jgi:hypothetical protein
MFKDDLIEINNTNLDVILFLFTTSNQEVTLASFFNSIYFICNLIDVTQDVHVPGILTTIEIMYKF